MLKSKKLGFWWKKVSLGVHSPWLLQCSVLEGDLHCQCILSIFPASVHQFYANILVYTNDQFALVNVVTFPFLSLACCFPLHLAGSLNLNLNKQIPSFCLAPPPPQLSLWTPQNLNWFAVSCLGQCGHVFVPASSSSFASALSGRPKFPLDWSRPGWMV